jgi:histidyl-tRNA synthetase
MKYRAPRGTQDILPAEAPRWRFVESTFRRTCAHFGYREIRTPIFEQTELFVRAVGEHTDIVSKEMYSVRAGASEGAEREPLTLRPEGTAPALRAYIQHNLGQQEPLSRLYYIAPNFRHERPQAGRLRQHHQTGIEALGTEDPAIDAEVIELGLAYLRQVGITGETLELNTVGCPTCRPAYREALLAALASRLEAMCANCQRRYDVNPLRILDCKVENWTELETHVPDILEYLCESCGPHFAEVRRILETLEIPYVRNRRLVRGLDYYVKTSFEITHPGLGAQSTILGGGRYDGLVQELGGPPTPGIGFGCGIERVLMAAESLGVQLPSEEGPQAFVAALGQEARLPAIRLLSDLRKQGISAQSAFLGQSVKKQMRAADRCGARSVLILGEDEIAAGAVTLKDMQSGEQETLPLPEAIARLQQTRPLPA